jgi:hypothetical protein
VALGGEHLRDGEGRELVGRIFDPFDFQADRGELLEDFRGAGIRIEMLFEPGQSELHDKHPFASSEVQKPWRERVSTSLDTNGVWLR